MTCCGQQMQQEGTKWVCGKYGAWVEPGTTSVNPEHPCGRCGGWHADGETCRGAG